MLIGFDRLPSVWSLLLAGCVAIAPITPEPHRIEKPRLAAQRALVRPLDIFDLAMHATPLLLAALTLWRLQRVPRR